MFIQNKNDDFSCENCKKEILNIDGYRNHCSYCLHSKHVDNDPGDRSNSCNGVMFPIKIEQNKNEYILIHKCSKCKIIKKNKMHKEDDFNEMLKIINKYIKDN